MNKKIFILLFAILTFIFVPFNVSAAVGQDGSAGGIGSSGNGGWGNSYGKTKQMLGVRIAIFKATKNSKGNWTFSMLGKAKTFYSGDNYLKSSDDKMYKDVRLCNYLGLTKNCPAESSPVNVSWKNSSNQDLATMVGNGSIDEYLKNQVEKKSKNFFEKTMGLKSNVAQTIANSVSQDISESGEQYFMSVELTSTVQFGYCSSWGCDHSGGTRLGTSYGFATWALDYCVSDVEEQCYYNYKGGSSSFGNAVNFLLWDFPRAAYINTKINSKYAYAEKLNKKIVKNINTIDCRTSKGVSQCVNFETQKNQMYGTFIINITGSNTKQTKFCKTWYKELGKNACGTNKTYNTAFNKKNGKEITRSKFDSTCCTETKKTCDNWKKTCSNGTKRNESNPSITESEFQSKCCTSTPTTSTCSVLKSSSKCASDTRTYDATKAKNSATASTFDKNCCSEEPACKYDDTSNFSDNFSKDCCKFFSQDNYKNLPSGITVDKFKEDYPQCFTGTTVTYSANDPSCGVMHTTYNIFPNVSFNTDTWIYLLKNSIGNTTTTFDSYNSSNKTVKMNTVCDSDEVKNNSNVSCSSTYDDDSTCNFVCYQKLIITLPGKPNGSLQIGQHFVWPNNSTNSKFLNAPLFAQTIRICRAMTNKVLDDAGKSACQVYFSNNNGYQASNTNITLNYDNAPYTGTETSLVAYSENNSEYESKTEADYGVQYSNASNGNSKTAKEYTFSKMTYYSLPENYFAYSPKSKLLLPTSSATDMTKYTSIGYGNLPISWTWKKDDEKQVTLNLSSSSSLGGKSIGLTYTCKFSVDDFGGPPNPNSCPLYSQKPGETPIGFEQCLKSNSYASCVSKYCYNDTVSLYCPQDCQDGKNRDCRVSEATTRLRTCMQSSDYETCVKKECPLNSAVVYRTISLASPFPGKNGIGRSIGTNWNNDVLVKTYITDTQEYYNKTPMYEITLGPNEISKIRTYNNTNGASGYLNDTLTCEKGKGIECRSDFIKQFKNLFQSNTCGMSIDWDECDSR